MARSLRPACGNHVTVRRQGDDGDPPEARPTGRPAVTLVEHWAPTLGANRAAPAPAGGHAGLTTGNPRWATMQWRDLPCIIRAHLSIRIKGYYA